MKDPLATVELLIRRPPADVFAAVADGEQITQFWLSKTSGPLVEGKSVRWEFMVEGAVDEPLVDRIEVNRRISLTWKDGSKVDWSFAEHPDGTVLRIESTGYTGSEEDFVQAVINNTQGYSIVVCDLKTYLESGRSANLARDKAQIIQEQMAKG